MRRRVIAKTDYPTKPITLVVPFDPGSGDTEARMFAKILENISGRPS
jgi:tripartite-type tricarboxylate transporter receptor subunit TctC